MTIRWPLRFNCKTKQIQHLTSPPFNTDQDIINVGSRTFVCAVGFVLDCDYERNANLNVRTQFSGWHSSVRLIKLHPCCNQGIQTAPGDGCARAHMAAGKLRSKLWQMHTASFSKPCSLLCNGGSYEASHRTSESWFLGFGSQCFSIIYKKYPRTFLNKKNNPCRIVVFNIQEAIKVFQKHLSGSPSNWLGFFFSSFLNTFKSKLHPQLWA